MNESPDLYDSRSSLHSIRPLPTDLRHGLAGVAVVGFVSFFASLALLAFMTNNLISWHKATPPWQQARNEESVNKFPSETPTLTSTGFIVPSEWNPSPEKPAATGATAEPPNQFWVLIFNLLLADIQQAVGCLLNVEWLKRNAIEVGTGACWAQGWFSSTGDLASSVFITGIAIHTYMSIVWKKLLPTWGFYCSILFMWCFVYGNGIMAIIATENVKNDSRLYVQAIAWCRIITKYRDVRLTFFSICISGSLVVTTSIYIAVFLHLQRIARTSKSEASSHWRGNSSSQRTDGGGGGGGGGSDSKRASPGGGDSSNPQCSRRPSLTSIIRRLPMIRNGARQHTFLLYPLIYVVCTTPLAAGRIASMAGHEIPPGYFCFAGAILACNGWLDVLLYSTTRRSIVFPSEGPPSQDTGLGTFSFMCPLPRTFGNTTTVTGGVGRRKGSKLRWNEARSLRGARPGGGNQGARLERSVSSGAVGDSDHGGASVVGMAIQCQTVTTVSHEDSPHSQITRPMLVALGRNKSDTSSLTVN